MSEPLRIDPKRCIERVDENDEYIYEPSEGETGIFVRAQDADGRWHNADISMLDLASLRRWLRSRGGENRWAESVVELLLGHDPSADRS